MDLLATPRRRKLLFALYYFAEGAPVGFLWLALPTLLHDAGAGQAEIARLGAVLVLPWALKFLWAPLVDVLRGPRWTLRAWIVAAQLAMAATLAPLAWLGPAGWGDHGALLTASLVAHALCAATQDAAIDALAIASTHERERGPLNGWMQAGMLGARALFGGGALLLASRLSPRAPALLLVATLLATTALALAYDPRRAEPREPARERARAFAQHLRAALRGRTTWAALALALTAGAGFEGLALLVGPFLRERGFSSAQVGAWLSAPAALLMALGGLAAGYLASRAGKRAVLAGAILAVALLASVVGRADGAPLVALLSALYAGIGALVASSYAVFMDASDPRLGATQFSAYMGATNLCEAWSAEAAGRLVSAQGHARAFSWLALASLLALPALALVRPRRERGLDTRAGPA